MKKIAVSVSLAALAVAGCANNPPAEMAAAAPRTVAANDTPGTTDAPPASEYPMTPEGARAFTYWTALQGDLLHVSPDAHVREKADDRMALLTPAIKAFLTDRGFKCASDALQLHGGTGYTREQGIEQFARSAGHALVDEAVLEQARTGMGM